MMMVCKKGVLLLLFEKGWWFLGSNSYIHLLHALRVVCFDHHRHVISFQ